MREAIDNLINWFEDALEAVPVSAEINIAITEAELQADLDFGRDLSSDESVAPPVLH